MTYKALTIDDAVGIFLLRTHGLSLARTLREKLIDSLTKVADAEHRNTRLKHRARVDAFLGACRRYPRRDEEETLFALAFPNEAKSKHFVASARVLRRHLLAAAHRLQLPWATNQGIGEYCPIPTDAQLMRTVMAFRPIKATQEKTIGHPLFLQTIRQHGWSRSLVEAALVRLDYDPAEAKRYVRMFAKNGAFESST